MRWGNPLRRCRDGRWAIGERAACALLAALALAPLPALAQSQGSAMARSEILPPVTVLHDVDMDFGRILPGTADGSVVMTPGSTASCAVNFGIVRTGPCRAARFEGELFFISGLTVLRPAGNQIMLTGPGGATMRLRNFTFAKGSALMLGGTQPDPQYFVIGGQFIVYVGGTLDVRRNQQPGIYNGTFTITLNYN
ncbi:MAG TPA: DUF4402 domain-containing protein [Croceibacterium sp.]